MNWLKNLTSRAKNYLSSQRGVVIIAICVGVVSILPYYFAQVSLGPDYKGMPLLVQDSEGEYLGRVHELIEGHYSVGSSVFYEYKDWPALVPPVGEWLYALPNYLFGMSIVNVDMFYKFLFPTLLFLLVYIFFEQITKGSRFWSIIGALLVTIGFDIPSFDFLNKLLFGHFSGYISPWTRPVNPITGMLFLAGYLTLVYRIFIGKSKRFVLPGLVLSLMIGYFFSFVFAGVLTGLLLVYSLCRKNIPVAVRLCLLLGVSLFGVLVLIGPSLTGIFSGSAIGGLNDPRLQGLFYTRLPLLNKTSILLAIVFSLFTWFAYVYKKEKFWSQSWWIFSAALLATNIFVFNIQVILGWTIWPQHFSQYTNVALSLVLITLLARGVTQLFPNFARVAGWIVVCLLGLLLIKTLPHNKDTLPILSDFQTQRPVMDWLNSNTQKDCVVFVVQDNSVALELNRFIPAFTNCDVYNSYNIYQGVPRERVFHNVLAWLWMKGITEKELPQFLEDQNLFIRSYLFRDWRDMFCCDGDPWIAKLGPKQEWQDWYKSEETRVEEAYSSFLKKDIRSELGKYRLDYVVVDTKSLVRGDLGKLKWLKRVYTDGRYEIYSFQK
jgi:hypothetical protein